jgi:hypothetical protein
LDYHAIITEVLALQREDEKRSAKIELRKNMKKTSTGTLRGGTPEKADAASRKIADY